MDLAVILCLLVLVLGIPFMLMGLLHKFSSNKWFCNKMGWHLTPESQGFDGCSFTGICPRCNQSVLQDGQGNWF